MLPGDPEPMKSRCKANDGFYDDEESYDYDDYDDYDDDEDFNGYEDYDGYEDFDDFLVAAEQLNDLDYN